MFPGFRRFTTTFILASLILAGPQRALAGWMGFRNETQATLVIQETTVRAGKPQKIYVNETIRDTAPRSGGNRSFAIFDSAKPDKPLFTGSFPCPPENENFLYVLKPDGKGGLKIEAQRSTNTVTKTTPKR
jgi:hypothetical protein